MNEWMNEWMNVKPVLRIYNIQNRSKFVCYSTLSFQVNIYTSQNKTGGVADWSKALSQILAERMP